MEVPGESISFESWEGKLLKQDFILNEDPILSIPFRSTPGVPRADFAGDRLSPGYANSTLSWAVRRP